MKSDLPELARLKNLGPKTALWLNEIGIFTRSQLARVGAVNAYRLLKVQGRPVSLNLVYAIEGALTDTHWQELPAHVKLELINLIKEPTG